jgi:hypothetical protein
MFDGQDAGSHHLRHVGALVKPKPEDRRGERCDQVVRVGLQTDHHRATPSTTSPARRGSSHPHVATLNVAVIDILSDG